MPDSDEEEKIDEYIPTLDFKPLSIDTKLIREFIQIFTRRQKKLKDTQAKEAVTLNEPEQPPAGMRDEESADEEGRRSSVTNHARTTPLEILPEVNQENKLER